MQSPTNAVRDTDRLLHRYDPVQDRFHVVPATRAMRAAATFLTDEYLRDAAAKAVAIDRTHALAAVDRSPPHAYLFHSAFCCSTLLANAFERPGAAMTLKEPVVLNDLSGWRRRGGTARDVGARLGDTLALLGANVPTGEHLIVKPSNVTIALAPAMMALRPAARAILMHAPLETFVASVASKGMFGRLWVRDLWRKLDADGLCALGFDVDAALGWTDLQVAAMGWLAQHRLFAQMTERFGARIATIDSASLLANRVRSIPAIAAHLDLPFDEVALRDIVEGPDFGRNAKTGEPFGMAERTAIHDAARAAHDDEIAKVVAWTAAVADTNGIALALPRPLLP